MQSGGTGVPPEQAGGPQQPEQPIISLDDIRPEDFALYVQHETANAFAKIKKDSLQDAKAFEKAAKPIGLLSTAWTRRIVYIILTATPEKRGEYIHFFIDVIKVALQNEDYHTASIIASSLFSYPLDRLHQTWRSVSQEDKTFLDQLIHFFTNISRANLVEHLQLHRDKSYLPPITTLQGSITRSTEGIKTVTETIANTLIPMFLNKPDGSQKKYEDEASATARQRIEKDLEKILTELQTTENNPYAPQNKNRKNKLKQEAKEKIGKALWEILSEYKNKFPENENPPPIVLSLLKKGEKYISKVFWKDEILKQAIKGSLKSVFYKERAKEYMDKLHLRYKKIRNKRIETEKIEQIKQGLSQVMDQSENNYEKTIENIIFELQNPTDPDNPHSAQEPKLEEDDPNRRKQQEIDYEAIMQLVSIPRDHKLLLFRKERSNIRAKSPKTDGDRKKEKILTTLIRQLKREIYEKIAKAEAVRYRSFNCPPAFLLQATTILIKKPDEPYAPQMVAKNEMDRILYENNQYNFEGLARDFHRMHFYMKNKDKIEEYFGKNEEIGYKSKKDFQNYAERKFLEFNQKSGEIDPPLNLSLDEIKALYIFGNFLNNGQVMAQGGYLRCADIMIKALKIYIAGILNEENTDNYHYSILINRDPDLAKNEDLLITDTAAIFSNKENDVFKIPNNTLLWQYQYTSRMHYDQSKQTYTIKHEDEYTFQMHPVLWNMIINQIINELSSNDKNEAFKEAMDYVCYIPFLVDLRVRQLFFEKLKHTKDPHIHQVVDQLIMACFGEKIAENEKPTLRWTIKLQCKTIRNLLERLGFPFKSTRLIRQFGICLASANLDPSILHRMNILLVELQALREKCGNRNQARIDELAQQYQAAKKRLETPAARKEVMLPAYVNTKESTNPKPQAESETGLFHHEPHYKAFAVATTPPVGGTQPKKKSQTYLVNTTSGEQPITITEKVNPKRELTSAVEQLPEALYDSTVDSRLKLLLDKILKNPKGSLKKDKDFDHLVDLIRLIITQMDSLHQQRPDSPINVVEVFGSTYPLLISLYGAVQGYEVKFSPTLTSPAPLPAQSVENFKSVLQKYAPLVGYTDIAQAKALTEEVTRRSLKHIEFPSLVGKKP
jgi:hypothetical protein